MRHVAKGTCTECGMANVDDEFHPFALCLLVKARRGDTAKARSDMARIIRAARSDEERTAHRVSTFIANQKKEAGRV